MSNTLTTRLLTTDDAACYLGLSRRMVQNLVSQKRLAVVRIASAVRYNVADLESFIARNTQQAANWKGRAK